jgi:GntR family transcriptional regulator/MocR family aminotransferase
MRIPLDRQGPRPLYRQIEAYLREAITSGRLPAESRLPASRELAHDLGVSRLTTQSAYDELEASGLVAARAGSGTYVLTPPEARRSIRRAEWPLWQRQIQVASCPHETDAHDQAPTDRSSRQISFAGGIGDHRLFPVDEFRKVLQAVIRRDGAAALDYGDDAGHPGLRTVIAQVLTSQGLATRPEDVLVTSGSQQALALISSALLHPGDAVLVEQPTYRGALDLFRRQGLRLVGIGVDGQGMRVEELEALLLMHHPRLIYTIPNFHNPTGVCLATPRRRRLVALAARHNIPIVEDDFVGDLRFEGRSQPALKTSDAGGGVLYVSTFSKMLMPGLRVGFVVAEGPIHRVLVHAKRAHDLASCNLVQRAVCEYVTIGRYQTHLRRSGRACHRRRDAMVDAMRRFLPVDVEVDPPRGGLFLWIRLPPAISSTTLLPLAHHAGVTFAPGNDFFVEPRHGESFLRLNFATHPPEVIVEGVKRLGRAMRRALPSSGSRG